MLCFFVSALSTSCDRNTEKSREQRLSGFDVNITNHQCLLIFAPLFVLISLPLIYTHFQLLTSQKYSVSSAASRLICRAELAIQEALSNPVFQFRFQATPLSTFALLSHV